jgi:hypothetical protein
MPQNTALIKLPRTAPRMMKDMKSDVPLYWANPRACPLTLNAFPMK